MARKGDETVGQDDAKGVTTKADAVRAALAEGVETPQEGVEFVKSRFGLDITRQQFSTYKSISKAKAGTKAARKPGREPQAAAAPAPSGNGQMDVIDAMAAIKELVRQMGADKVKRMVSLFE